MEQPPTPENLKPAPVYQGHEETTKLIRNAGISAEAYGYFLIILCILALGLLIPGGYFLTRGYALPGWGFFAFGSAVLGFFLVIAVVIACVYIWLGRFIKKHPTAESRGYLIGLLILSAVMAFRSNWLGMILNVIIAIEALLALLALNKAK